MLSLLSQGATIKTTRISDSFVYEDYLERAQGTRIPLVAWNQKGQLTAFRPEQEWQPTEGWTVASLALDLTPGSDGTAQTGITGQAKYGI